MGNKSCHPTVSNHYAKNTVISNLLYFGVVISNAKEMYAIWKDLFGWIPSSFLGKTDTFTNPLAQSTMHNR